MITKGIIKSIDLLGNTCTVHLPFFETAGNDPIIETATVSNTPGSYNGYKVGDVVYVAFEDGNMDTPVVIGKLYLGTEKEKADPRGVSNVEESTTTKKATLPADAKLAAEIDSNVPNTTVPYSSLSSIANGLNTLNTNVVQMDRDYGNRFKQVISNADGLKSELEQTAGNMVAKVYGCELDAGGNPIRQAQFGWSLQEGSWTVFNQDKNILTADGDGLHISGQVDAKSGHIGNFMIGNSGISSSATASGKETAWSSNYTDTPKTNTGVYVGPDGIKLGKNFSVDTEGKLSTRSLEVIDGNNTRVFNADANTGIVKMGGFTVTDTRLFAGENSTLISLGSDDPAPKYITFTGSQIMSFQYDADFFINYFTDTVEIKVQLNEPSTNSAYNQIIFGYWNDETGLVSALGYIKDLDYEKTSTVKWYYCTSDGRIDEIDTGIALDDFKAVHTYAIKARTLYVDGISKGTAENMGSALKECQIYIGGVYYIDSNTSKYDDFLYGNVYGVKITKPDRIFWETDTDTLEYSPDVRNDEYGLRLINSIIPDYGFDYNFETPINKSQLSGDHRLGQVIYAGSDDPKTAPFSVTNTGELTATKGKIGNFNISETGLRYRYKSSSGEDGLLSISADSKNTSIFVSHKEANHGMFDDYVEIKADGIVIGSSDPFNSSTESSHWITVRTWTPGSASIIYEYDLYLVSDSASDDTGYVRFKRRTAGVGA